jgi:hypothetical protein
LLLHLELLCMSASVNCNVDHEWDLWQYNSVYRGVYTNREFVDMLRMII